jgi:asparagine synthase (glutamine-hydrolysing)
MTEIFTLLNNSNEFSVKFIKEQLENIKSNTEKKEIFLKNVMIKAIFGSNNEQSSFIIKNDIAIIFDGIIYNYNPLNNRDIEVIIDFYIKYGIENTLEILDGIFSFVLIDYRLNNTENGGLDTKMYFARDPYGVKPLYILKPIQSEENISINMNEDIYALSSNKEMLNNYLDILNENSKLYDIEDVIPGTYSILEQKYKVLSPWCMKRYMIPYHTNDVGLYRKIKISDELSRYYLNDAILKRSFSKSLSIKDKEVVVVVSSDMESNIIAAIINNNLSDDKCIKTFSISGKEEEINKIEFISNHIESNNTNIYWNPGSELESDEQYKWELLAKDISKYNSNSMVLLSIGLDKLIDNDLLKTTQVKDDYLGSNFRFTLKKYLKSFYKEKIGYISNIFRFYGLEIDFPFLDRNLTQFYITNNVDEILINPIGIYGGHLLP